MIHLAGYVDDDGETVKDLLLVRTQVSIGDEIKGVRRFQNGICHITGTHDCVIYAKGVSTTGEAIKLPIGEYIDWDIVRRFPVICNAFMRQQDCDEKLDSKVIKMAVTRTLRASRWAGAMISPFWEPADGDNK